MHLCSRPRIILPVLLLILSATQTTALAALPVTVEGQPLPSLAPILDKATPAVVNINTETRIRIKEHPLLSDPFFRRFFDAPTMPRERRQTSLGSGVIVDAEKGYVISNHHVIGKADTINVTLTDGRSFKAKLIGADPATDISILQIPADNLTAVPLADSEKLRVGDFVIAIGNPFGLGQTVTSGIVSALGRSGLGIEGYENFIQTDASINPGNSGGALINLRGELVGINTAILAAGGRGNIGIGFAIPTNMARSVMRQIIDHGEVRRGRLGAQAQDLTPELAKAFNATGVTRGAVVVQISPRSPADKAGLMVGDVIIAINRKSIRNADDLRTTIGLMRVGDDVLIKVMREGRIRSLSSRIAETDFDKLSGEQLHPKLAGLLLGSITESSPYYGRIKGVMVLKVKHPSAAAATGLKSGDIITSVNRVKIDSPRQALEVARDNPDKLLLNIRRGNSALFLMIR
ncbi:MAG: Do family serine endopeptidase [Gammaproteobacteria bacterium]|nr:MAG: Do family serine endopeptidase [Gammaproteobacteria bacterium]